MSRLDWLEAGEGLLSREGIAGMRLKKLTARLKVSTGSFYHHFKDMSEYLAALAEHFREDRVQALVAKVEAGFPDPRQRIRQLAIQSQRSGLFTLDRAMRVWAASDARAATSIKAGERVVLAFLADAFRDAGFRCEAAALRARILLSVRNASLLSDSEEAQARLRDQTLDLLLSPEPSGSQRERETLV